MHARWADGKLTWVRTEGVVRRRRWKVTVTYQTPSGPQKLKVAPKQKCMLTDITKFIDQAIRDDVARTGNVWDITWEAIGK